MQSTGKQEYCARKFSRFSTSATIIICISFALPGCGTVDTDLGALSPTNVSGDRRWTPITTGMTDAEFIVAMSANGYELRLGGTFTRKAGKDETWQGTKVLFSSYGRYEFEEVSGGFRLRPTSIASSCTFAADEGGAFEAIFPMTKSRTKELFANSATPLGFLVGEDFPDRIEKRSYLSVRIWPSSIEEMLSAQFEEVSGGTKVIVNTESDLLVAKGRDQSFARSILEHMHCTAALLNIERADQTLFNAISPIQFDAHQKVKLSNYRVLSSAHAIEGGDLEFVVAEEVIRDGNILVPRGATAWGEIIKIERSPVTAIHIDMTKVQAADGQWHEIALENGPLVLRTPADPRSKGSDTSQAYLSSAHIVYPIGSIVTATFHPQRNQQSD